jgi:hypothetical protein
VIRFPGLLSLSSFCLIDSCVRPHLRIVATAAGEVFLEAVDRAGGGLMSSSPIQGSSPVTQADNISTQAGSNKLSRRMSKENKSDQDHSENVVSSQTLALRKDTVRISDAAKAQQPGLKPAGQSANDPGSGDPTASDRAQN